MRYIRQEKKKPGDKNNVFQRLRSDNPMDFTFPEIEEYFIYNPKSQYPSNNPSSSWWKYGIKIAKDAITYCTSGLVDRNKGSTLSYLHKSIKSLNQLRMIEDSLVIYRLSRAPERRIFYIDVGNLPKVKAEQYLRDVMMRYRNKLVYNADTGEIRDDKKVHGNARRLLSFPGVRAEEEPKSPLSLADKTWEKSRILSILKRNSTVRLTSLHREWMEKVGLTWGDLLRSLRDELKFTKFVGRLRKRFFQHV